MRRHFSCGNWKRCYALVLLLALCNCLLQGARGNCSQNGTNSESHPELHSPIPPPWSTLQFFHPLHLRATIGYICNETLKYDIFRHFQMSELCAQNICIGASGVHLGNSHPCRRRSTAYCITSSTFTIFVFRYFYKIPHYQYLRPVRTAQRHLIFSTKP